MRRILGLVVLTVALAAATYFTARRGHSGAEGPGRKPFTAFLIENRYASDGKLMKTEYSVRAVASDGSEVTVYRRQAPNQQWIGRKVVVDVPSKRRVTVDPITQSLTTYPLSDAHVSWQNRPMTVCTQDPASEKSTLLGYEVVKTQESLLSSDGITSTREAWLAPALDCFALAETSTSGPAAGPKSRNTFEVLYVVPGEPARALFEIPSDYTERTPSQVFAEYRKLKPDACANCEETGTLLDKVYSGQQKNR